MPMSLDVFVTVESVAASSRTRVTAGRVERFAVAPLRAAWRSCGPRFADRRLTAARGDPEKLEVSWASSRGAVACGDEPAPALVPARAPTAARRHAAAGAA